MHVQRVEITNIKSLRSATLDFGGASGAGWHVVLGDNGAGRTTLVCAIAAAVVFLHATLEDLLRSVLEWRLPVADAASLREVPLTGKKPRSTITLDELAAFRGLSVQDVIQRSVVDHLDRSNFNDPGEVDSVLEKVGLQKGMLNPHRDLLGPMMKRRHWIVHRADRDVARGPGHHAALPLGRPEVDAWSGSLRQFGEAVLNALPNDEAQP